MDRHYDVIIVGARVAGSSLAYELSKSGYKVLLADKSSFPSDVLSTHNFFGNSVAKLREMGVLDRLLQTGAPLYKRAVIQFEDVVIDGQFPEVDGETECLCVRRVHLDHILFEHASSQPGVTSIEGFRVTDVIREGNAVTGIAGVRRGGEEERFTAKLVVGADGRNSTLRERVNSARAMAVPTDFASYVGYFKGYEQAGDIHVELYKIRDKIGIVFPTDDDLHVVGVMFPLDDQGWSERFARSPENAMRELIDGGFADSPLPERLRQASLVGRVRGLRGYDNDWHQGMGEGWALVGDAFSFKDPAVGQGMQDALYSARILTDVLSKYDDWGEHWEEMAQAYQSLMEAKMMSRFHMACQFTKNVPFGPEQTAVNRLVAAHPEATRAFLGIYNHAVEPQEFEQVIGGLLAGNQEFEP
ncbi:NAD(P)/FAD-dependent oxidoreductase [Cohnella thailandensis]|uniref:NAD(P)/FAD-dependent oxidoreductase n=1 Tax=Cohnella thailandensis TaxID=557557 RepID=A0A841STE4_9BACL|nr:NAD(P)/FAD-dependent oxidoreductase [Cohnella thailandensis]MBB6634259.1 NAD(P)/FAD-dependent oxidoreductase [Cohnella thailandensis]MBP1972243.1 2-polyprenyl-6-methoxyphenol hydroxylase-like FAD-dependent oxidoreductase [Cohnella thailandensis]